MNWVRGMMNYVVIGTLCAAGITLHLYGEEQKVLPKIANIWVTPPQIQMRHPRDYRSVIVMGASEDGRVMDLTFSCTKEIDGDCVSLDTDGYLVPQRTGSAKLVIKVSAHTVEVPVEVCSMESKPVDYVRDLLPLLSKYGCNQGTCHGAQQGRRGFKLSLRGYDPLFDYRALVDDVSGRRFDRADPSQSLMLLKPTQGVPHEGGFLFDEDSQAYKIIYQWIAEGCRYSKTPRPANLEVIPTHPELQSAGQTQQLIVIAHYPDGESREVTREAIYESGNFEVATVNGKGLIKAVRRGETPILIKYEGAYQNVYVTVMGLREGFEWRESPEYNYIDKLVNSKLKHLKINPSELCTDAEFLRRVSLDLTGLPATAEKTRKFLEDPRPSREKRAQLVEELLNSSEYVDHWTLKWSDLLLANRKYLKERGVWSFRHWIRRSLAENQPYHEFVYELITATGDTYQQPAGHYYRVAREPKELMENMTQVFLGIRFVCAQCHDHPFERWTQHQYYHLASYFAGVQRLPSPYPDQEIIFDARQPEPVKHISTGQPAVPKFPYDISNLEVHADESWRVMLARWLTSPENPYFARSLVNRYWSYLLGRGLIEPVDDIRLTNPPTNPELLDALTTDFVQHGFDRKHLLKTIVNSHTYQRSYLTNDWNYDDDTHYSHAVPRRLQAEQLYDAIVVATGAPLQVTGAPAVVSRAAQLPDSNVALPFLELFGKAPRESPCECERSSEVSLAQTLALINGPTISEAIAHPQGLVANLVANHVSSRAAVEEIYLSVLNRFPTASELRDGESYLETHGLLEGGQDLMWGLLNSPAFLFNR